MKFVYAWIDIPLYDVFHTEYRYVYRDEETKLNCRPEPWPSINVNDLLWSKLVLKPITFKELV